MKRTGCTKALRSASRLNSLLWGALALLLLWTSPAPAEDSPLAQVPADASVVVQLHGIERTKDRIVAFVKNALPDLVPKVEAVFSKDYPAFEGRKFIGLKKDGPHFLIFTELPAPGADRPKGGCQWPTLGGGRLLGARSLRVAGPTPPRWGPGSAVLIYLPGTAQLRKDAHPVDRARQPFWACCQPPTPSSWPVDRLRVTACRRLDTAFKETDPALSPSVYRWSAWAIAPSPRVTAHRG